jgi:vancomycin resistance protein YoaR
MKKKILLYTSMLLFAICLFSTTISTKVFAESEDEVITKGVYIDTIHIGGMTVSEAKEAIQSYVDDLRNKQITVYVDTNKENITLGDFDYNSVENDYIRKALEVGQSGNLIKRYKELKDIEETNLIFQLEFTLNDEKIREFVETKLSTYDVPAVDATITRSNGKFQYTEDTVGRKVQVEETIAAIKSAVVDGWNQQDMDLYATVVDDEPKITTEMVQKCDTILGTFSTTYTTSSADRAGNLANGAKLINNTVLYPGDVFSAYEKLTPFTVENGYYQAGAYANGRVVDSIGGGACQVTTTLYNAVLFSELEIVERAAHSMTIGYVDLSMDAAIAGTWKDLKFKNNTDVPIIIEAYTSGRTITFNVWGNETRDKSNRRIEFETVVLDEKAPGPDVITEDPAQLTTYEVTTQSAHIGYTAELYKIVYENGVEVSRTRINKSIYNASPRYVTVGTKEVEPEKPKDEKPKANKPKDNTDVGEDEPINDDTETSTPGANGDVDIETESPDEVDDLDTDTGI